MRTLKRVLKAVALLVVLAFAGAGGYAGCQARAYNASMQKVYEIPLPNLARSSDPAVIARGKHLVESIWACTAADCHKADLGGGGEKSMGPIGTLRMPNITAKGRGAEYSDGELARLILHGVKRDGRGVILMPSQDMAWWPDEDVQAAISYVRSVPPVERAYGATEVKLLGKVLDRKDMVPLDVARRIDHGHRQSAPAPAATAAYGEYLARSCRGCHGETLSGGRIPGTPPEIPAPLNITPHETGLKEWSFEDFDKLLATGVRKNGKKLDPFMPVTELGRMNEVEKRALWAYLQTVPAKALGGR
jgi:cytochrome c553